MTSPIRTPIPITKEPKWTCDRDGNWKQVVFVRFRDENGNLTDKPLVVTND